MIFPMLTHFIKIMFVKIPANHTMDAFKSCEAVRLKVADLRAPKFQFSLESSNFITGKKYGQLLSWT